MSLSNKTMPLVIASLLAASTIFGQNQNSCPPKSAPPVCQPVKPTCQPQICKPAKPAVCGVLQEHPVPTIAAYNAPAEINIGMQDEYNFFVMGSFIYWQPLEDNMSPAVVADQSLADLGFPVGRGHVVNMDFNYKPGFKVGLGMNLQHDCWVGYAEYTRIHGNHSVSSSTPSTDPRIFATRGHPFQLANLGQVYSSMSSNLGCNLDLVDGQMERVYYVGQNLVFHSSFGARGAWILQKWHTRYSGTVAVQGPAASATDTEMNVYERLHSWAVGPRTGLKMDWILGDGFRFFGNAFADILYTKYKQQGKSVVIARTAVGPLAAGQSTSLILRNSSLPALRTHMDLELGLGWGTYLNDNGWHIDFAVGYDFQVFFNQNMFTHFEDNAALAISSTAFSNLYMQGLNVTARVDF